MLSRLPTILPPQLIRSLKNTAGFDEAAFTQAHTEGKQVTSIRLNPEKYSIFRSTCSTDHLQLPIADTIPWCPHGKYLTSRPSFTFDPLFHAGMYYVQEASSMFLWHLLAQTTGKETTGLKVLDLCAAPGGKSTLLAAYFPDGFIVANEVIKSRAGVLVENMTKWGASNVVVTNNDPKDFRRLPGYFDIILVDAPCSGSGLFRKDTDAISEWSEEAVLLCSARQQRILADAYACLKQNGLLIYSTCSYSKEEDEDISDWLMDNFRLAAVDINIPAEWNIVPTKAPVHEANGYRFYPDKIKGEGFFIAAFTKQDGTTFSTPNFKLSPVSRSEELMWKEWLAQPEELQLFKQKELTVAIPATWQSDLAFLQKHLYIKIAGTAIGNIKGKDIIPHPALALSMLVNRQLPAYQLSGAVAVQYLQKKEMEIAISNTGWQLATYCAIPLGWMKVLPNRINNYYPLEWRILKN